MNNFRSAAPALGQTFVKPVNAGRKPGHQLRMQTQNEPQRVIFDCITAAPTTSATLMATIANISPSHLFQSLHHQKLQLSPSAHQWPPHLYHSKPAAINVYIFWRSLTGVRNHLRTSFEEWLVSVRIHKNTDQKKLLICTLFTQCVWQQLLARSQDRRRTI